MLLLRGFLNRANADRLDLTIVCVVQRNDKDQHDFSPDNALPLGFQSRSCRSAKTDAKLPPGNDRNVPCHLRIWLRVLAAPSGS